MIASVLLHNSCCKRPADRIANGARKTRVCAHESSYGTLQVKAPSRGRSKTLQSALIQPEKNEAVYVLPTLSIGLASLWNPVRGRVAELPN